MKQIMFTSDMQAAVLMSDQKWKEHQDLCMNMRTCTYILHNESCIWGKLYTLKVMFMCVGSVLSSEVPSTYRLMSYCIRSLANMIRVKLLSPSQHYILYTVYYILYSMSSHRGPLHYMLLGAWSKLDLKWFTKLGAWLKLGLDIGLLWVWISLFARHLATLQWK